MAKAGCENIGNGEARQCGIMGVMAWRNGRQRLAKMAWRGGGESWRNGENKRIMSAAIEKWRWRNGGNVAKMAGNQRQREKWRQNGNEAAEILMAK